MCVCVCVAIPELQIKELDGMCSLPYVWQLAVTFKMQRSCIKMLSIMRIRFIDVVAVTELSSAEAMLITGTEES